MQLSEHFSLEEFVFSETAARHGMGNAPEDAALANLRRVAGVMEQVRTLLGKRAIFVHSGYRSPEVNRLVGGSPGSAHCRGLACDFVAPEFGGPAEVARAILRSAMEYDQLILEYGWVHLGLAEAGAGARREALTKRSAGSPYEAGIVG